MAGFASFDEFVTSITTNNQFVRTDWYKITGGTAYTIGRWYDHSILAGFPVATLLTGGTNLAFQDRDESTYGIPHGGNVTPKSKHLVNMSAFSSVATAVPSVLQLVDVLGFYPVTTTTTITAQTLNNTVKLPRYATGAGVRAYIVATGVMGAGTPNITISYTNQAGVAGRTMPVTVSALTASIAGHIIHSDPSANKYAPFLPLQAGDTGIRSIQTITLSATMTSGALAIVLCKPIQSIPITIASVASERNLMNQLPSLPKIEDGACLSFLQFAGAATAGNSPFFGSLEFAYN